MDETKINNTYETFSFRQYEYKYNNIIIGMHVLSENMYCVLYERHV